MPATPLTPEQEAEIARVATFRLILDNKHDPEMNPRSELFTGTHSQAFSRAGDMWNDHPCVVMPDRGWRLRGREVLNANSGRVKEKLGRIVIDIA